MKNAIRTIASKLTLCLAATLMLLTALLTSARAQSPLDNSFNPNSSSGVETAIELANGQILVGGTFTTIGGQARTKIALLNADGTVAPGFNVNIALTTGSMVRAIALLPDGKILLGGTFSNVNGQPRDYLCRLNADGSLDAGFNLNTNNDVEAILVQSDGKILVAGRFSTIGGQAHGKIARLNPDGSLDNSFNLNAEGLNPHIYSLVAQPDGKYPGSWNLQRFWRRAAQRHRTVGRRRHARFRL